MAATGAICFFGEFNSSSSFPVPAVKQLPTRSPRLPKPLFKAEDKSSCLVKPQQQSEHLPESKMPMVRLPGSFYFVWFYSLLLARGFFLSFTQNVEFLLVERFCLTADGH